MAVRIVCSACNTVMQVADELRGKKIKCKTCSGVVSVVASAPAAVAEFAEAKRMPPPPPTPAKRRLVDKDERPSPRRRRDRNAPAANLLPLWIGGGALLVVIVAIVLVLALRSGPDAAQANNNNPPAQNQQAAANPGQQVNAVTNKRVVDDPPAGEPLKGEQIYQRMLKSTVWIVAEHRITNQNQKKNRPFTQELDPDEPQAPFIRGLQFPQRPGLPNIPRPQIGPPGFPNMFVPPANQSSTLTNSVWDGNETLPGFGKLQFQFINNIRVVMVDARETMTGSFVHTANNVTITFGGGVVYNGTIRGNNMSGSATNGQNNWTWTVSRGGGGGSAPANPLPGGGIVAKSSGSGSLIDRKYRLIVTNVHVVGNGATVAVYFPEFDAQGDLVVHADAYKQKPGLVGRVVMKEERADLALVQLDRLPDGVQPVAVVRNKAKVAQQVHSVGNPGASKGLWIYSPGKVRQVFKDEWKIFDDLDGKTYNYNAMKLETDSQINPGDSGGPLVDDRASLVGVAHGANLVANAFSFFIEASEVRQLLERYYRSVNDVLAQGPDPGEPQVAAAAK